MRFRRPKLTGRLELAGAALGVSRHTTVLDSRDAHRLDLVIRDGHELELRIIVEDVDALITDLERGRAWLTDPTRPEAGP